MPHKEMGSMYDKMSKGNKKRYIKETMKEMENEENMGEKMVSSSLENRMRKRMEECGHMPMKG